MFSFHKPRVYRSSEGCCICRAKSSSSRFTDSKKYEDDSVKCFNLETPRQGEICNACVLLVKRFKRLPVGSNRHWGHVVDARIGPGMKSMSRFKKLKEECQQQQRHNSADYKAIGNKITSVSEKFCKIFRKNKKKRLEEKHFKVKRDDNSSDENFSPGTPESLNSDDEETFHSRRRRLSGIRRRKNRKPMKLTNKKMEAAGFFDENDWVSRWSCCGLIHENSKIGALLVDFENCKPCSDHFEFFRSSFVRPSQRFTNDSINEKTEQVTIPYAQSNQFISTQNTALSLLNSNGSLPASNPETIANSTITIVNKNHSALKKHHLYYKRHSENFIRNEYGCSPINKPLPNTHYDNSHYSVEMQTATIQQLHDVKILNNPKVKNSFMHKTKSDVSKMAKTPLEKAALSLSVLPRNVAIIETGTSNDVKSIVTSSIVSNQHPLNISPATAAATPVDATGSTKFSDNSSDSGFDENLPDQNTNASVQLQSHDGKERKLILRPMDSLFLSSADPKTLPAAHATSQKVTISSHKTIQKPHNIAVLNSHKIRAIYNSATDGGLTCGTLPSSLNTIPTPVSFINNSSSIAISSLSSASVHNHKKYLYVKGKQNVEISNN